jgi:hypothetical protein
MSGWLTPCSRADLDKLTGLPPVKKFPVFYGSRRFIAVFTTVRHWLQFWAKTALSTPRLIPLTSVLTLYLHLRLGRSGHITPPPLVFPTKIFYEILSHACNTSCQFQTPSFDHMKNILQLVNITNSSTAGYFHTNPFSTTLDPFFPYRDRPSSILIKYIKKNL